MLKKISTQTALKNKMSNIFFSKYGAICFGLILVQQLIVAFSTAFIGELAKSVANGHIAWLYFFLFIFSLIIVYVPAAFARIYLEKARYSAQYSYANQFIDAYRGKIHLNSRDEEEKLPFITTEGQSTIDATTFFLFDFTSISLNVLSSLITLSYIIHPILLLSYAASFLLLSVFLYLSRWRIKSSSKLAQLARTALLAQLLKSWRNIVINNRYNYKIWRDGFEQNFEKSKQQNVKNQVIKQIISSTGMIISLLPLLLTLIYLMQKSLNNFPFLALIIATLPRQIQMIQNMDIIVQYASEWTDLKERLLGLQSALMVAPQFPEKRIQWKRIQFYTSFNPLEFSSFESLKKIMDEPGRITIRGENGTGKTTLLKCLKERFNGYYLPATPNLSFASKDWQHLSTGEQILTALQEVEANDSEKLLLLDEWDANLDSQNREKLSRLIDQLAMKSTIIEVIHRKDLEY